MPHAPGTHARSGWVRGPHRPCRPRPAPHWASRPHRAARLGRRALLLHAMRSKLTLRGRWAGLACVDFVDGKQHGTDKMVVSAGSALGLDNYTIIKTIGASRPPASVLGQTPCRLKPPAWVPFHFHDRRPAAPAMPAWRWPTAGEPWLRPAHEARSALSTGRPTGTPGKQTPSALPAHCAPV